ncbi:NAD(P)-dependent oxidoreductase [Calidithermus timidus]|jgi:3-hydroxyisobutyrate dehydrogenase-like beta-hydroxyacid dehydrogenase|uniref:NAD(P)-dependent oxidoreductase n=1 Tax=Calidithermus timidus TaxID=307124 RepID=UPI0003785F0C|nr:NAD(P)-dependent oxidoreductase [Calidithermus timidus]
MPLRVAVLGLGEAGGAIAQDLLGAGAEMVGYDPLPEKGPPGIRRAASEAEAAQGAGVVLSVNWARVALEVAHRVAPVLAPGQVFADLNTAAPALKRALHEVIAPTGALFADIALMSPVPGKGLRTPSLASGPGALAYAERLGPLGAVVEGVGETPGAAATRKLLRSIFFKGLAAAVGEALEAARRLGLEAETRQNIAQTLEEANAALIDRLEEGSRRHALRRQEEMLAAAALLEEVGLRPVMARATAAWLEGLRAPGAKPEPGPPTP